MPAGYGVARARDPVAAQVRFSILQRECRPVLLTWIERTE
jgi:hypothetical protein